MKLAEVVLQQGGFGGVGEVPHVHRVHPGVVVADEILDGPRSVVIEEARNRMLAQMAVLHQLMNGSG